jgi:hypothetical protein
MSVTYFHKCVAMQRFISTFRFKPSTRNAEAKTEDTFDEYDPYLPFVENVPLDDLEDNDLVETRTYDQGRIQKIKVKGSFADAIAFSNAISAKKKEDE